MQTRLKKDLARVVDLFPKLRINETAKTLEGEIDIFDAAEPPGKK
jgi:hypothetical protein